MTDSYFGPSVQWQVHRAVTPSGKPNGYLISTDRGYDVWQRGGPKTGADTPLDGREEIIIGLCEALLAHQ